MSQYSMTHHTEHYDITIIIKNNEILVARNFLVANERIAENSSLIKMQRNPWRRIEILDL